MPTTADELTVARSWIGTTEATATFDERFDRHLADLGDREDALHAAIEESLRAQLSAMTLDQPGSMSLPGGISASYNENIRALKTQLQRFLNTLGSGQVTVSQMHRDDTR